MRIFDSSLQSEIFPDKWKIARVSHIFKTGETYKLLTNILTPVHLKVLRKNNVP